MPETPPLPWVYPYREYLQSTRLGQPILRPFVLVSLVHASRFAQAVAVEDRDTLDERFGTVLSG